MSAPGPRYVIELALRPIADLPPEHYWYGLRDDALRALDMLERRIEILQDALREAETES